MEKDPTVLLIDEDSSAIDSIRRALGDQANRYKLRRVADLPTALARILGGGVDLVLLTLPVSGSAENPLAPFLELRKKAPSVPVVVLCDSAHETVARSAVEQGAAASLLRGDLEADLLQALRTVAAKTALSSPILGTLARAPRGGKIVTFMGVKGGVGTTTVAMNVAAALSRHQRVILIELHAELGSLHLYFQPHRSIQDIGDFIAAAEKNEAVLLSELESRLWPVRNAPGLKVLYASRSPQQVVPLDPGSATGILALAAEISDYVIVDLPVSLSETNRAVLENSDCLALVVERDPVSVQSAKLILSRLDTWKAGKLAMGAVILNRAALVSPMPFAEIDAALNLDTLGVIPPAADLCAAAQHAHSPIVILDSDSLASVALLDLSRVIEELAPAGSTLERTYLRTPGAVHVSRQSSPPARSKITSAEVR